MNSPGEIKMKCLAMVMFVMGYFIRAHWLEYPIGCSVTAGSHQHDKKGANMMYRKNKPQSAVSFILATFVIFLVVSCATGYHRFVMKGSIIETPIPMFTSAIGSRDGAAVGQELDVYKILQTNTTDLFQTRIYWKVRYHLNYR